MKNVLSAIWTLITINRVPRNTPRHRRKVKAALAKYPNLSKCNRCSLNRTECECNW